MDDETLWRWMHDAAREAFELPERRVADLAVCMAMTLNELRRPSPYVELLGWRRIA